jgi:hypothetical protein
MVEAGFATVFVGIETPNDAGLSECSKSQNRDRDDEGVSHAKARLYQICIFTEVVITSN